MRALLNNCLLLTLLSALVLTAGCSSEEARTVVSSRLSVDDQSSPAATDSGFGAEITLCRKVSRKSGRPIGVSDNFKITAKSYVNALVEFTGVRSDRTYVVHLVWVRPDGKEMFRKYAEVTQSEISSAQFQTSITWLDAEDLHKIKLDTVITETPEFTLQSRFNISSKKNRQPGQYSLQVFLDRRLLLEEEFIVTGEEDSGV